MRRVLCLFRAIAVLGVFAAAIPAQAADASPARSSVVVCGRGLENPPCASRPTRLEFSDNHDLIATGLAWRDWGRAAATSRADITVNWTGTPSIHRGRVTLSDLRPCHGERAYRTGRVSWAGESVVIHFDCRAAPRQPRYLAFRSADGSLGCGMAWDPGYGSSARCDVASPAYQTPVTADCQDLDQGDSLVLGETVASTCHGDTVLRAGPVLVGGQSRRVGDILCAMTRAAVSCRNLVTGHGFRMSQGSYRVW